ncbi:uncharacterized protein JCM15063_001196 [Sporobolomyces koalae]|uniref:uncharacterized protein n=1 Tax=Sporobolomyces koalae TaxID=500713 RepID=UPI00317D044D
MNPTASQDRSERGKVSNAQSGDRNRTPEYRPGISTYSHDPAALELSEWDDALDTAVDYLGHAELAMQWRDATCEALKALDPHHRISPSETSAWTHLGEEARKGVLKRVSYMNETAMLSIKDTLVLDDPQESKAFLFSGRILPAEVLLWIEPDLSRGSWFRNEISKYIFNEALARNLPPKTKIWRSTLTQRIGEALSCLREVSKLAEDAFTGFATGQSLVEIKAAFGGGGWKLLSPTQHVDLLKIANFIRSMITSVKKSKVPWEYWYLWTPTTEAILHRLYPEGEWKKAIQRHAIAIAADKEAEPEAKKKRLARQPHPELARAAAPQPRSLTGT